METRLGDTKHGDFAARRETLPRDERLGSFADSEKTEPHDERPGWFSEGLEASRTTGSRRPSIWPPAAGTGLNE